jgi:hypothetical protein
MDPAAAGVVLQHPMSAMILKQRGPAATEASDGSIGASLAASLASELCAADERLVEAQAAAASGDPAALKALEEAEALQSEASTKMAVVVEATAANDAIAKADAALATAQASGDTAVMVAAMEA